VLEDERRWGEAATDWQREDARAELDPGSPTPDSLLTRPRGDEPRGSVLPPPIAPELEQERTGESERAADEGTEQCGEHEDIVDAAQASARAGGQPNS
jgi:hypothetical protein